MTMDIANHQQRTTDLKISAQASENRTVKNDYNGTEIVKPSLKRSFDVAFLMMPDERIRQRQQHQQQQIEKQQKFDETIERQNPADLSPRQIILEENSGSPEIFHNHHEIRRYPQITIRSPRIYDDPSIIIPDVEVPKSAFTKVSQGRLESPAPPLSPDQLSCPSMSPPTCSTPPRSNGIYSNFRSEYQLNGAFQSVAPVQVLAAQNSRIKQQLMYRPMSNNNSSDILPGYMPAGAFPFVGTPHPFVHQPDITGIVRSPAAAAILSTLIPPTLASTFSLTAQNVCAKCNISFRMTSDLVYHMRSHHKSEVACDPNRRKREEKLKCPVCNESFRERHHLTRHMTAHQDKESDQNDIEVIPQRRK